MTCVIHAEHCQSEVVKRGLLHSRNLCLTYELSCAPYISTEKGLPKLYIER